MIIFSLESLRIAESFCPSWFCEKALLEAAYFVAASPTLLKRKLSWRRRMARKRRRLRILLKSRVTSGIVLKREVSALARKSLTAFVRGNLELPKSR